jgi:hypothetical protein
MNTDLFPPTETELEEIIFILKKKLEDERYKKEWEEIADLLEEKENQLKQLTIKNFTI